MCRQEVLAAVDEKIPERRSEDAGFRDGARTMAGETIRSEAICLSIRPWSQTSHVVTWLTPVGKVATVVKGAVRPKSSFLGQYDLNYTCDVLYYARAKGDVHALREAYPVRLREGLRTSYRALALADYLRSLVSELAPAGTDCQAWYAALSSGLDDCERLSAGTPSGLTVRLVRFELEVLRLSGLGPDFSGYDRSAAWSAFDVETGSFAGPDSGRLVRVEREVAEFLDNPLSNAKNQRIPLDAARVIGVFYSFHLDCASDVRRTVLRVISQS